MFVVRGFPASPATGQPVEAGGYLVRATVNDGDFTAEVYENFEITPQEVELDLLGVLQVADGSPKTIEVIAMPEGSSAEVVFAKRDDLPVEEGLYPFFVRLSGGNFSGSRSGVMRLVAEKDTSPPVITLTGSASVAIEAGSEYTDAGATATDNVDGAIAVVVDNKVNTQVPGSYLVSFTATDAAGNAAVEVTRTVIVEEADTSPLVITSISTAANGDLSLTWNSREGQTYAILAKDDLNEPDISLWDELDGSIQSQGASTTAVISSEAVNSITNTGKIFFRVRKQR